MNALELADELETRYKYAEASECMLDAATMLRQQQAEIAELKHMNRNWQISESMALAEIEELKAKTLTDEEQFKDAYMVNFLSAYMAVRYDNDCANGHPLKGYQPIEDAQFLANEAWAILRKANEK